MAGVDGGRGGWVALGRQLAASRLAAGLSQQLLADLAAYSRSTVANVETGRQHVPREFWVRCDHALGTGTALVGGYDQVVAAGRRAHAREAAVARRMRAGPGLALSAGAGLADSSELELVRLRLDGDLRLGAVGGAELDTWEQAAVALGEATRIRLPGDLLVALSADLAELDLVVRSCRAAGSLRRLARVAAQLSGLACLLFVRLDDRDGFRRWAGTARAAANEAGDAGTLSWVLAQQAYGHYYAGELGRAVNVARHAQGVVRLSPGAGAAMAAALEARAHAARGDERETRRALGRAEAILGTLDAAAMMASEFGCTEAQFRLHESSAYTRLGQVRLALAAQDRALAVYLPGDYTDWGLTRLDRASCLLRHGDPAAVVAYAVETMNTLGMEQRSGSSRRAEPSWSARYQASPAARELHELLYAVDSGESQ